MIILQMHFVRLVFATLKNNKQRNGVYNNAAYKCCFLPFHGYNQISFHAISSAVNLRKQKLQKKWTQIRLLHMEQSDLGSHCLPAI